MEALWQDVRYGLRMLVKSPGFTAVAVLTLALGIGANTAMFSGVESLLLRRLPFPRADRIVQIWEVERRHDLYEAPISPHNFAEWRRQARTLEKMAEYEYEPLILTGTGEPARLVGARVSAEFFEVLGVRPQQGRAFLPSDDVPGSGRVAILSYGLWQRRFGADPTIVGRTLTLDRETYTVVGVMSAEFQFPEGIEIWAPLAVDLKKVPRGSHFLFAIGRLGPGVSVQAAQAEMDSIANRLAELYPGNNADRGVRLVPLREQLVGRIRLRLVLLLGAVGFVLLIACANVANLLLARASTRQKEFATRVALGAGRARLARQILTETLLLTVIAGGTGWLLAAWGLDLFRAAKPRNLLRTNEITLDVWALLFATGLSILAGFLASAVSVLQTTRPDLSECLKDSSLAAGTSWRRLKTRGLLVVAEVSLAVVLLVGAGLMVTSVVRLAHVSPGFDPEHALTLTISLPPVVYPDGLRQAAFFQNVLQRLDPLEGVRAAGAVSDLPFSGSRSRSSFSIEGREPAPGQSFDADRRVVTPSYFRAMGIPLQAGREFTERETKDTVPVIIVNQAMARRFWPGENPLGKRIRIGAPTETAFYGREVWREVVGVVGDIRHERLDAEPAPEMYVPNQQFPAQWMSVVVRATGDPLSLVGAVRDAVRAVDPDQPIYSVVPMKVRLWQSIAVERLNAWLLGGFAALATVLAAVGIYGVVSYNVSQRTHEIGIRMALGAQPGSVLGMVLADGLRQVFMGLLLGLVGALALTQLMKRLLFQVTATDPVTYVAVALLLIAVAVLACWVPARRATRVDPAVALRYE